MDNTLNPEEAHMKLERELNPGSKPPEKASFDVLEGQKEHNESTDQAFHNSAVKKFRTGKFEEGLEDLNNINNEIIRDNDLVELVQFLVIGKDFKRARIAARLILHADRKNNCMQQINKEDPEGDKEEKENDERHAEKALNLIKENYEKNKDKKETGEEIIDREAINSAVDEIDQISSMEIRDEAFSNMVSEFVNMGIYGKARTWAQQISDTDLRTKSVDYVTKLEAEYLQKKASASESETPSVQPVAEPLTPPESMPEPISAPEVAMPVEEIPPPAPASIPVPEPYPEAPDGEPEKGTYEDIKAISSGDVKKALEFIRENFEGLYAYDMAIMSLVEEWLEKGLIQEAKKIIENIKDGVLKEKAERVVDEFEKKNNETTQPEAPVVASELPENINESAIDFNPGQKITWDGKEEIIKENDGEWVTFESGVMVSLEALKKPQEPEETPPSYELPPDIPTSRMSPPRPQPVLDTEKPPEQPMAEPSFISENKEVGEDYIKKEKEKNEIRHDDISPEAEKVLSDAHFAVLAGNVTRRAIESLGGEESVDLFNRFVRENIGERQTRGEAVIPFEHATLEYLTYKQQEELAREILRTAGLDEAHSDTVEDIIQELKSSFKRIFERDKERLLGEKKLNKNPGADTEKKGEGNLNDEKTEIAEIEKTQELEETPPSSELPPDIPTSRMSPPRSQPVLDTEKPVVSPTLPENVEEFDVKKYEEAYQYIEKLREEVGRGEKLLKLSMAIKRCMEAGKRILNIKGGIDSNFENEKLSENERSDLYSILGFGDLPKFDKSVPPAPITENKENIEVEREVIPVPDASVGEKAEPIVDVPLPPESTAKASDEAERLAREEEARRQEEIEEELAEARSHYAEELTKWEQEVRESKNVVLRFISDIQKANGLDRQVPLPPERQSLINAEKAYNEAKKNKRQKFFHKDAPGTEPKVEPELEEKEIHNISLEEIKKIIGTELGKRATIISLDINEGSHPDEINISADLNAGMTGGRISIKGSVSNKGNGIAVNPGVIINARGYVKSMIESNLENLNSAIREHFENKYGKSVSRIEIQGNEVVIEFKQRKPEPAESISYPFEISPDLVSEVEAENKALKREMDRFSPPTPEKEKNIATKAVDWYRGLSPIKRALINGVLITTGGAIIFGAGPAGFAGVAGAAGFRTLRGILGAEAAATTGIVVDNIYSGKTVKKREEKRKQEAFELYTKMLKEGSSFDETERKLMKHYANEERIRRSRGWKKALAMGAIAGVTNIGTNIVAGGIMPHGGGGVPEKNVTPTKPANIPRGGGTVPDNAPNGSVSPGARPEPLNMSKPSPLTKPGEHPTAPSGNPPETPKVAEASAENSVKPIHPGPLPSEHPAGAVEKPSAPSTPPVPEDRPATPPEASLEKPPASAPETPLQGKPSAGEVRYDEEAGVYYESKHVAGTGQPGLAPEKNLQTETVLENGEVIKHPYIPSSPKVVEPTVGVDEAGTPFQPNAEYSPSPDESGMPPESAIGSKPSISSHTEIDEAHRQLEESQNRLNHARVEREALEEKLRDIKNNRVSSPPPTPPLTAHMEDTVPNKISTGMAFEAHGTMYRLADAGPSGKVLQMEINLAGKTTIAEIAHTTPFNGRSILALDPQFQDGKEYLLVREAFVKAQDALAEGKPIFGKPLVGGKGTLAIPMPFEGGRAHVVLGTDANPKAVHVFLNGKEIAKGLVTDKGATAELDTALKSRGFFATHNAYERAFDKLQPLLKSLRPPKEALAKVDFPKAA